MTARAAVDAATIVRRMTVEIRPVRDDELPAYFDALSTAFLDRPDVDKVAAEVRQLWDLERTLAAFDADRLVATFRSFATELTVPGGACLPASAVSAVTVLPTHRRRGILRAMIAAEHAAVRERGEVTGLLHAAEYPIYARFGYGPATTVATWTLDRRDSTFRAARARGSVELVRPSEALGETLRAVFDAHRLRQPGEIRRRDHRWAFDLGLREQAWGERWKGNVALHRDASGAVDGYVRYRPKEKWEDRQPRGTLTVDDLFALTVDAYDELWRFLGDVDLVTTIKAEGRRVDERMPWLLVNARAATASEVGDGLWVRLFDVPRALEARTYEREGSVTLELIDAEAPGGRLRVRLDATPDGATCRATDRAPDLTLDVSALGAAYLGGTRLRDAVLDRGVDEHRAGALAGAEALLRTAETPWCATFF